MVTLVCIQLKKIASGNGNFKEKKKNSPESYKKKQAMRQSGRGRSRPDDKKQRGPRDEVPASVGVYHITGCERENQPVIMEREFN